MILKYVLLILYLVTCFGAVFFKFPGIALLYTLIYLFFTLKYYTKKSLFGKIIIRFFLFLLLSIVSCRIFRGQGFYITSMEYNYMFAISFYFYLLHKNIEMAKLERIFVVLCTIFCVSYIIQYIIWPTAIFDGALSDLHTEENKRIRIGASGLAALSYFYGLNKIIARKGNKCVNYSLLVLGFIVIGLLGFRTMIAGIFLFTGYLFYKHYGLSYKIVIAFVAAFIVLLGFLYTDEGQRIYTEMMHRQENETFENSDYIRVVQFNHFTNNHFLSEIELFFGSGLPSTADKSSYGKYFDYLDSLGINFYDWGLIGLSWMVGIPAVICIYWYGLKAGFTKVINKEYNYLGIWFLYMILISITTYELPRNGNFIIQALVLFAIEKVHAKNEKNRNINISPR